MNQNQEHFTHEEKIKNEIELMKLKLEVEQNAIIHTSEKGTLPPEVELAWYNHITNYEQLCKQAGYTTVYDFIGNPVYKSISELLPEEIEPTLQQLCTLMYEKGVELTYLEDSYPPKTIYRFITEELFLEQICRYKGPEGNAIAMFCYEEFYPNHTYDLTTATEDWMESIFGEGEWHPKWINYSHAKHVTLNLQYLSDKEYSDKVFLFKENFPSFLFIKKEISFIEFDLDIQKGTAKGMVQTNAESIPFILHFQYEYCLWLITHVEMKLL